MGPSIAAEKLIRTTLIHKISWLVKPPSLKIASSLDFERLSSIPGHLQNIIADYIIPAYCFDFNNEQMCCTCIPKTKTKEIYLAPFLYNAQRASSTKMLSIAFENLGEFTSNRTFRQSTFIFSPGRTGSTLLSRLLAAANKFSVSEPDLLTQLSLLDADQRSRLGPAGRSTIIRACLSSFYDGSEEEIFIKLRSHCTLIEAALVSAIPNSRAVFMFRDINDWATSRRSQFRENPKGLAQMLRRQIVAIDRITSLDVQPIIVWYEDLLARPFEELSKFVVIMPDDKQRVTDRLATTLDTDSQKGSALARGIRTSLVDKDFLSEFHREWVSVRPHGLIEKHRIEIA